MQKINVLVVDDEPGIRGGIRRILSNFTVDYPFMDESISFEILEAETGEMGLEIVAKKDVDIILLDNKLPGIQGMEVLERVSQSHPDILVLMITSYASLDTAVKATEHGAHDFVPKPFTPQELKSSIETVTKHLFLKRVTKKLFKEGKQVRFQFLSMLSHELKTPLNTIEGYLNMMKESQMGPRVEDYFPIIERSLERIKGMRNLILDLLDLTQIETGKVQREIKAINLPEIISTCVESMRPYSIQKEVSVSFNSPDEITIYSDAEDLEIIFNNLISNAIKYNKAGGKVAIVAMVEGEYVIVNVEDDGIGISEEDLPKIFNEFFRIKNQKTKSISGTGLGLSIVKRLVEQYNGEISVSSIPDRQTIFSVKLPIKR